MANNQNEQEFFAVVATGRKGLEEMTDKMGGEIMQIAAKSVAKAGPTWLKRAIVSIANNENLADVLKTKAGLFSVYKALTKAATMGLQIGGQFPQCHLTPFGGKAELVVSAEGYRHTAVHGPGAVLSDCVFRRVYEGEQFFIDFAAGTVKHNYDGKSERGKLLGVYGVLTRQDGATGVDYMTKDEALNIRNTHSTYYKSFKKGPWVDDEDAMVEKTAAKKFLRKYAAEAEGLAMLFGQDRDDDEPEAYKPPSRDVSERMAGRLEKQAERMTSAPKAAEPEPIQAQAEVVEEPQEAAAPAASGSGDLF